MIPSDRYSFFDSQTLLVLIIIRLAYLYCAAYTRMTMNESSPPCEQRRITINDDEQRVQLVRPELSTPHYICMYRLLQTTPPSPSRHYYPRLIAGTNLPTPLRWIAWLAKADCTHVIILLIILIFYYDFIFLLWCTPMLFKIKCLHLVSD